MEPSLYRPREALIKSLEELEAAIKEGRGIEELRGLFDNFFNSLEPGDKPEPNTHAYSGTIRVGLAIAEKDKGDISLAFWRAWGKFREENLKDETSKASDLFAFLILKMQSSEILCSIHDQTEYPPRNPPPMLWNMYRLRDLGYNIYYNMPNELADIGLILSKLTTDFDQRLVLVGKKFIARSQFLIDGPLMSEALRTRFEKELKKTNENVNRQLLETKDKVSATLEKIDHRVIEAIAKSNRQLDAKVGEVDGRMGGLEKTYSNLDKSVRETESRSLRNFVQILGIFAAIIAFVVAAIVAAIRLGGASIPIIGTGLAVVLTLFLFLLAYLFRDNTKKEAESIKRWLITSVALVFVWLILSIAATVIWPGIVAPPAAEYAEVKRTEEEQIEAEPITTDTLEAGDTLN